MASRCGREDNPFTKPRANAEVSLEAFSQEIVSYVLWPSDCRDQGPPPAQKASRDGPYTGRQPLKWQLVPVALG